MRTLMLLYTTICAIASLWMMMLVGRNQQSVLLIAMFTFWVASPFAALVSAQLRSKEWTPKRQTVLYALTLLISLASVALYALVAFGPPRPQPASFFLLVPLASWVVIAIAWLLALRR